MMKRINRIFSSLNPHAKSFILALSSSPFRQFHCQPCHYPHLSPSSLIPLQQKLYFSSKSTEILDLVVKNQWSQDLEIQLLKKFDPIHENVVYVLNQLEGNPKKAFDFFNWVCNNHGFNPSSLVYNQMVLILCSKETLDEFWGLIQNMSNFSCDIDERVYATVLGKFKSLGMVGDAKVWSSYVDKLKNENAGDKVANGVVDVVLGCNGYGDLKEKLLELKVCLSDNGVLRVFRALYECPLKALCVFRWLEESLCYTHNAVTYNGILRVLAKQETIQEFWTVFKEMKNAGYCLDFDTYTRIFKCFERFGMLEDLVQLYELMMDGQYKPSSQDCGFILRDIARPGADLKLCDRVVKIYEAAGGTSCKAVYDGRYRCLANAGRFDEAQKVLEDMRNAGIQPDKTTCGHGLFALGKEGRLDEALKMVNDMGYIRDLGTWKSLIKGLCKRGDVKGALKCYDILLKKNLELDADLLEVLVNCLCCKGRVDTAYTLVTDLADKAHLRPSRSTCIHLIQCLLGERKLQQGLHLLHLMKSHNLSPIRDPFVDYISRFGTAEDAIKLLDALSVTKFPAYHDVLQSFIKVGRHNEARLLHEQFPYHIRNHDEILYLLSKKASKC